MQRPMRVPSIQLTLFPEPKPRPRLEGETCEALIAALADLLLEAYASRERGEAGDREDGHES